MASSPVPQGSAERPIDPTDTHPRKRKRPRVPDEQRQRSSVACANCRRLKEKCDGNTPCSRCLRTGRSCETAALASRTARVEASNQPCIGPPLPDERVKHLEYIAKHFLGDVPLTEDYLSRIVQNLQSGNAGNTTRTQSEDDDAVVLDEERFTVKPLSQNTAHYSGEFSHWNFSQRVQRHADQRLQSQTSQSNGNGNNTNVLEYWRASELKSRSARLHNVAAFLPPREVALFLVRVYFSYAQTNTFFVEEFWIIENLEKLYSGPVNFTADDSTWLCTTISVLAVATQFVDMTESGASSAQSLEEQDLSQRAAEAAGISLYHMAADLVPDIIAIASVESSQALLLLAHFALPLDTQGLTYSYLGLALRMAIQNGMHRRYSGNDLDASTIAYRSRLWWTVYRLEKRISILHGRPTSIAASEIDADLPVDGSAPGDARHQHINLENTMTKITDWLGDFAFVIHMLRKCPSRLRHAYFERLVLIRSKYLQWWPQARVPDLTTSLSRSVAHIHMAHDLNVIFLGRPFIFSQSKRSTSPARDVIGNKRQSQHIVSKRLELVNDAVASAKHILEVCRLLHSGVGLAKSSYMEFSSCRAAVLVLLAQGLNDPSRSLREAIKEGMRFVNQMAPANQSTRSEASVLAAIEAQLRELDSKSQGLQADSFGGDQSHARPFETFKSWAAQFHEGAPGSLASQLATPVSSAPVENLELQDAFDVFGWSPFDATITDESPNEFDEVALHHFEDVFSIANLTPISGDV